LPEILTNPKGKARKTYRYETLTTPYTILGAIAHQLSDTHAANRLQKARLQLFTTIHDRTHNAS